jgi:uncharacterized protein YjbI with pentapeptide repeats
MSPQVTAAIIAASVGVITLIATVVTQYFGRRATSRDTQKALEAQRVQLDRTLGEQRTRTLNDRFAAAAGQLGSDKPPEVRLAGVYAIAGLADDWPENRQTCVDVLCGYLRMPYEPDPGEDAPGPERLAFRASREVRHTVIRVITAHLKDDAAMSWQGYNFDFTGVVFDGGDFRGAQFSGGTVDFGEAQFSGGTVDFGRAQFSGGTVDFSVAEFSGGTVDFGRAQFSGGTVYFSLAQFSGCYLGFRDTQFSGGMVLFSGAYFSGSTVDFSLAHISGGMVDFRFARFSGGTVAFSNAQFSGGTVPFEDAQFSGGAVHFGRAQFSGGEIDFRGPGDWSVPPTFPWTDTPPPGVKLPEKEDQSQA